MLKSKLLDVYKRQMLENCCYDAFALTTLNMVRQGVLGEITHAEGAYIHEDVYKRQQECFVTSPTRFLLCTMVLMNSKRKCKNNV